MKDLGELRYFLGIQVHRDRELKTIHISQSGYNRTILERYGIQNSKPVNTPLSSGARLTKATATGSRDHVQWKSGNEIGALERCKLGRRRRKGISIRIRGTSCRRGGHLLFEEATLSHPLQHGIGIHGSPPRPQGANLTPPLPQWNQLRHRRHLL